MKTSEYNSNEQGMITAVFSDRESAERAYQTLLDKGYSKEQITVLMSDDTRKRIFEGGHVTTDLGNKAMEGAGTGSAIGGTLGAIAGAVAAIGTSLLIPGLGLIIAGPLVAAFAGAGAGGVAGGIIGALIGAGIPEERAARYESALKDGRIVIGVKPRSGEDASAIEREWVVYKGEDVYR